MGITTNYDVRLRYSMDDRASRSMRGLERNARGASAGIGGVTRSLIGFAAAGFGLQKAASALVGYNATVQDTKLQIGGMLALARKTDLVDELKNADKVFANLQARAKSLPGTTQEYTRFAGMITQPIMDAGLGMKALEDLTVNAVVAAKALGYQADLAARDIDQALRGQFHSTDPFAGKILGSIGYKGEDGRAKYNALSADKRASELQRALMQKQLSQLADAQGKTFTGVWSTLKDNLEQTLGKVGLPLFRRLGKEVEGWNKWIDQNGRRVQEIAGSIGSALVTGFGVVKDALGFLVDHAGLLMSIGKVWLAVKAANMLGGLIGAGGEGLRNIMAALTSQVGLRGSAAEPLHGPVQQGAKPLGSAGGSVGALDKIGAIVGGLAGGYQLGAWIEENTGIGKSLGGALARLTGRTTELDRQLANVRAAGGALDQALRDAADRAAGRKNGITGSSQYFGLEGLRNNFSAQANAIRDLARAEQSGELGKIVSARAQYAGAGVDEEAMGKAGGRAGYLAQLDSEIAGFNSTLAQMPVQFGLYWQAGLMTLDKTQLQALDQAKAQSEVLKLVLQRLNQGLPFDPASAAAAFAGAVDPEQLRMVKAGKSSAKPKVNVTIQHFEVQSDDPDRFAFGFVEALRDVAKNPSGALGALREG